MSATPNSGGTDAKAWTIFADALRQYAAAHAWTERDSSTDIRRTYECWVPGTTRGGWLTAQLVEKENVVLCEVQTWEKPNSTYPLNVIPDSITFQLHPDGQLDLMGEPVSASDAVEKVAALMPKTR